MCGLFTPYSLGRSVRTLRDTFTVNTDDSLEEFTKAFTELKVRFRERVDLESWKIACTMKDGVIRLATRVDRLTEIGEHQGVYHISLQISTLYDVMNVAEDQRLESLPGAKLDAVQWDLDLTCLRGTRKQLLDELMDWVHNPASERILWLSGAAGTGKSSVANSIAEQVHSLGRLGAFFRFNRDVAGPETPGQLFGNLCYQLALFDDQLRTAVLSAIHRGSGGAMSLRMQAKTLFVETTKDAQIVGPVVVVVDALDESGTDSSTTEPSREKLVRAIIEELPALPPSIKVLITSRDEGIISRLMPGCLSCLTKRIDDAAHTEEDILQYIRHRMVQVRKSFRNLPTDWPGAAKESELAAYADGLFIWASVACKHLEGNGDDPNVQLAEILGSSDERVTAEAKLDRLYMHVLCCSLPEAGGIRTNNWQYVLGAIVTLKTPLTYHAMDSLLYLTADLSKRTLVNGCQIKLTTSYHIISSLRPILRIDRELKDVVRLLHKSVFDFLTGRAEQFIRVDLGVQNGILAMQCLDHMNRDLRYDICGIGDPSRLNTEIDGLHDLVRECIPESLQYACRYFAYHLIDASIPATALVEGLQTFITENLMHWIEAMSLMDRLYEAEISLQIICNYLEVSQIHLSMNV